MKHSIVQPADRGDTATVLATMTNQTDDHPENIRPWGHYEQLAIGPRFQVKSIVVNPGGKLSLQSHFHRSEHWIVVEGSAIVTKGSSSKLLTENEAIYIAVGEMHRLENPGKVPMRLIEIQTGMYFGEDDILRYDDDYGRC